MPFLNLCSWSFPINLTLFSQLLSHLYHNGINKQAASGSLGVTPDSFPQAMGFWLLTKCKKSASVIPSCQVPCSNHLRPAAETRLAILSHKDWPPFWSFHHVSLSLTSPSTTLSTSFSLHWSSLLSLVKNTSLLKWKFSTEKKETPFSDTSTWKKLFLGKKKIILTFQIDHFWLCASKLFPSQTYAK